MQIFGERHNEEMRSIFEMGSALLHVREGMLWIFGERHNEEMRSIFEMGSALLHASVLISILQEKQPVRRVPIRQ